MSNSHSEIRLTSNVNSLEYDSSLQILPKGELELLLHDAFDELTDEGTIQKWINLTCSILGFAISSLCNWIVSNVIPNLNIQSINFQSVIAPATILVFAILGLLALRILLHKRKKKAKSSFFEKMMRSPRVSRMEQKSLVYSGNSRLVLNKDSSNDLFINANL